jgi:hypothetical protein
VLTSCSTRNGVRTKSTAVASIEHSMASKRKKATAVKRKSSGVKRVVSSLNNEAIHSGDTKSLVHSYKKRKTYYRSLDHFLFQSNSKAVTAEQSLIRMVEISLKDSLGVGMIEWRESLSRAHRSVDKGTLVSQSEPFREPYKFRSMVVIL